MSISFVEVTTHFNNKSAKFCTLISNSIYFKKRWCFHDFSHTKFFLNVYIFSGYWIKMKWNEYDLPVSLKKMKFLQNILQRYTIVPEFFGNFKSIINGCFRSGGKTWIIRWQPYNFFSNFWKKLHMVIKSQNQHT
jgi:hypothetical protein